MATNTVPAWYMSGDILGACNCDWGCPCNFDARPTHGFCEGSYVLVVREGRFGEVVLDGVVFLMGGRSPGPIHEGNGNAFLIVDERATPEQRDALVRLWRGDGVGMPFEGFAEFTTEWFDPIFAPVEARVDGVRSTVKVEGIYELTMSRIPNPVTGDEEEIYLDKPTGFTSLRSEMGNAVTERLSTPGLSFEHSDTYAEHGEFNYSGP